MVCTINKWVFCIYKLRSFYAYRRNSRASLFFERKIAKKIWIPIAPCVPNAYVFVDIMVLNLKSETGEEMEQATRRRCAFVYGKISSVSVGLYGFVCRYAVYTIHYIASLYFRHISILDSKAWKTSGFNINKRTR